MMELRSCSNLHLIQAAKGGLLVKTLNAIRGRPVLKFKELKDIYETLGVNNQDHFLRPKDEFERLVFDSSRVKVESPSMSTAGKGIIKCDPEASEFNCSGGGDSGRNSVVDDLGFGDMTLKQLKERCKAKKRKRSKCVDLSRETDIMCSGVKQEYSNIEIGEDERDLMEPLSSWKSKLAKNKKSMSKCLKKRVSAPRCASSIIKSEDIPSLQDFLQYKGDLPAPIEIKREVPELDCSDYESNSSLICDNHVGSCGIVPEEVPRIATECVLATQAEDPQICVVNEAYYEYMDNCNAESVHTVSASCRDIKKVDDPEIISHNLSASETKGEDYVTHPISECVLGTQAEDHQICVVNEAYYEYMDNCNTEFVHTVSASCGDIEKVDDPVIISHNLSVSETKGEDDVIHPISDGFFQEPISPTSDQSFGTHYGYQSFSINHEIQCQIDSEHLLHVPDMVTHNFDQFMEPSQNDACPHGDDSRDYLPSNLETSALHTSVGDCSLGSNRCLVSSAGDPPVAEEKESERSDCGDAEGNFSDILHHDAFEEFPTTVDVGFDHYSEMMRPPERLFPTRKTISPASQEKLCKALESVELHDEEHYGGKKKLCFAKVTETKTKIHRTEGPDQVRRIRFSIKPKHMNPKNEKRDSHPKGFAKVPNLSPAVPRFSTECTSIQSCSQSAIAFSERQMHDIECLATKLTNELKTMKEIAEESLWSESYPAASLKYNAKEVRMAIKSATRVEQTAQRWLSMMSRDCSRFCKIMRLTEKGSDAPKSVVNKERKKITFADEAGEKLCHVKIFDNDLTSSLESDCENLEVLVK